MGWTKRPDNIEFAELYKAILADFLAIYPADHLEVMRDSKRIALELQSRGLPFFTMDLPDMGKILDRSLAEGRLIDHNVPCFGRKWKTSPIPKLFSGFWIRLFDRSGHIREDIDPDVVFYLRTLLYACKKLNLDCKPERVYDAVKEYFDVDDSLPPPNEGIWNYPFDTEPQRPLALLCDVTGISPGGRRRVGQLVFEAPNRNEGSDPPRGSDSYAVLAHCQRTAGRLAVHLGSFDPEQTVGRHGPGAVSEVLAGGTKYVFPSWGLRLEEFFPWDYHGVTTVDNFLQDSSPIPDLLPAFEEAASKLCAVPKTQKGPRLIASEPVCNQWIQQGLARLLRERVASSPMGFSIDFFDQEPSRKAALDASRHGRRSTIDLSSASDRMSCWLVESMFRSNLSLLRLMAACRTRFLTNPLDKKSPSLLKLRKFASMGSALTFPVQSIVFTMLAIGVGSFLNPKKSVRKLAREVRVFGDDIIIPNSWVETFVDVLSIVGLKVNQSKTFTKGNFRESCGMDAWMGYDVTPPYIRWPSAELVSRSAVGYVAVSNNFFLKGLWRTAAWLDDAATWMRKLPVVNHRAAALGRATFCNGLDPLLKLVWDKDTQQMGVNLWRVIPRRSKSYQVTNPNGMMEYSVNNLLAIQSSQELWNESSWKRMLAPKEVFFPLSTLHELPPDGSTAVMRRRWMPVAALSAAADRG
jgi:hypothetical protein